MANRTRRRSPQVADAHEEIRRLKNRLHEIDLSHLPLRAEIQRLKTEAEARERKLERARRVATACRGAFLALVATIHALEGEDIATGKVSSALSMSADADADV